MPNKITTTCVSEIEFSTENPLRQGSFRLLAVRPSGDGIAVGLAVGGREFLVSGAWRARQGRTHYWEHLEKRLWEIESWFPVTHMVLALPRAQTHKLVVGLSGL